jgi:multidrug resistance protein
VGWGSLVTVPLVPAIAHGTGMVAESGALLVSAYALAFLLAAPVFGVVSNGFGRKNVIVAGMLVLAAGTALTGLGNGLVALLAARAVTGIGAGMVAPSVFALVGDLFPYEERGRATGVVSAMLVTSNVLGVPLSGVLAEAAGWRWAFFANAALAALALAAVLAGLPEDRLPGQTVPGDEPDTASDGMKAALATPTIGLALLATFLWYGSLQGTYANVGLFYARRFGLDAADIGVVLMLAGLRSVAGNLLGGVLSDKVGKRAIAATSAPLAALGVSALTYVVPAVSGGLVLAVGANLLWALAFSSGFSALAALVSELNEKARGAVLALNTSSVYTGSLAFTAASTALLGVGGFPLLGVVSAVAALAVVPLVFRLGEDHSGGGSSL